jgi:tRNA threonylcarbamoyladenosine biosynthesis protein TsaB
MRIVAVDAATSHATIAVTDGSVHFLKSWRSGRRVTDTLALAIEEALTATGGMAKVDAVVVGVGPGSYTGIRVAMALTKGLCLASGTPLVGVSTLESVAYACGSWRGTICAAVGAGSGRVAIGVFHGPWSNWERSRPERAEPILSAEKAIVRGSLLCGEGADLLPDAVDAIRAPRVFDVPRADVLAQLGEKYFRGGGVDVAKTVVPNYLRPSSPEERLMPSGAS